MNGRQRGMVLLMAVLGGTAPASPGWSQTPEPKAGPWILFASSRSGAGDLYAVPVSGGEPVLVVGGDAAQGGPRWDPARARVVHQRFDTAGGSALVGGTGAEAEVLFADPSGDSPPVWSPDGRWIVWASRIGSRENLYLAAADGVGERRLTEPSEVDRYPTWSPDGRRVAFVRRVEGGWRIAAVELGRSGAPLSMEWLSTPRDYVGHLAWSPDGQSIAFDTDFGGEVDLALLDVPSGTVHRLTRRAGNDLVPTWSPDGTILAFSGETEGNWDVWTVEPATGALTRLTDHPAFDGGPVFVPSSVVGLGSAIR